jgi:hypothetical protein
VHPCGGFDGLADRSDAGPMTFDPGQLASAGPAAVAVHDDGDVSGERVRVQLLEQFAFRGPDSGDLVEGLHRSSRSLGVYHRGVV